MRPANSRDEAIAAIKADLKRRSGRAWSVTGGRGTAWGWITITAPPARRTWEWRETAESQASARPVYEAIEVGLPGGSLSPADRLDLARMLSTMVGPSGESIPASSAHYREYRDRAAGRPYVVAEQYWD